MHSKNITKLVSRLGTYFIVTVGLLAAIATILEFMGVTHFPYPFITPHPTASVTASSTFTPAPDVLYAANWPSGISGWVSDAAGTTAWHTDSGQLVNDGSGCCLFIPPFVAQTNDYTVQAKMKLIGCPGAGSFGLFGRGTPVGAGSGYEGYTAYWGTTGPLNLKVRQVTNNNPNTWTSIDQRAYSFNNGDIHTFAVRFSKDSIYFLVDGQQYIGTSVTPSLKGGYVGIEDLGCQIDVISFEVLAA